MGNISALEASGSNGAGYRKNNTSYNPPVTSTTAQFAYDGDGSEFELMLEDNGVISICRLATFIPDPFPDLDFDSSPTIQSVIIRSEWLQDLFNELESNGEIIMFSISNTSPILKIVISGSTGSTEVKYLNNEKVLEAFSCLEDQQFRVKPRMESEALLKKTEKDDSLSSDKKKNRNKGRMRKHGRGYESDTDLSTINYSDSVYGPSIHNRQRNLASANSEDPDLDNGKKDRLKMYLDEQSNVVDSYNQNHGEKQHTSITYRGYVDKPSFRTTKAGQKLKILPDEEMQIDDNKREYKLGTEEANLPTNDVLGLNAANNKGLDLQQELSKMLNLRISFDMIKKSKAKLLPRVTTICKANSYKIKEIYAWAQKNSAVNSANTAEKGVLSPKIYDECLYIPNIYADSHILQINEQGGVVRFERSHLYHADEQDFDKIQILNEAYIFDYGVVVLWGMTRSKESVFLEQISQFSVSQLSSDDQFVEEFNFFYNKYSQPRIFNDIFMLKNPGNFMTRLAISHALAQSSKISLFEELVEDSIEQTKHIPQALAQTGAVQMSRKSITKIFGQLFMNRFNFSLVSNILDTPEIFWSEPNLQPVYSAFRSYLEIPQRIDLLNHRVSVIGDLLEMLKNHLNSTQGVFLEMIIIALIAIDIVVLSVETLLFYFQV
ncbi:Sporulation protein RMD1 [Zancudomyces culisetae]|uniref:Sporulation protein RMD1 n=1 Tax=Zancudomyces culisetae TaxID=1213189 RepID=A0A1R1PUP8_ZANCU|nr:Sporulation protein RMD1 [Zancudomyces culisetae]|eukprot:OMH84639.1 Sporulation protein RMD1 [Zancudomyces culisetae]